MGFNITCIIRSCKNNNRTAYGFLWSYDEVCKEYIKPQSKIQNKPIYQYDINGNFIKEYVSIRQAAKENNIDYRPIYLCCENENRLSYKNFIYGYTENINIIMTKIEKYKYSQINNINITHVTHPKPLQIEQYTKDGEYIQTFISAKQASEITGLVLRNIYAVCMGEKKNCGGYIWKYQNTKEGEI